MQSINVLCVVILSFFISSCALMNKESPEFDDSRVPGEYQGQISCSYEPCEVEGPTIFTITKEDSYFILHFEDSISTTIPDLDFKIELDRRSYGEAVTISGFIQLKEGQDYALTPYDQHHFYYWTYYDTQQEGERFEMKIYKTDPDKYLELTGHRGIQ